VHGALPDRRRPRGRGILLPMQQLMHLDRDLELEFIREFSVHGELLKGAKPDDRRERIRIAIYVHNLVHQPFRDSGMDYAAAYQKCYRRPIELRRTVRHEPKPRPDESFEDEEGHR
jgi:hypothetical protein